MAEIQFSIMQLIEETTSLGAQFVFPAKNSFSSIEESFNYNDGKTYLEISTEKEDDYVFFVFNFGNPSPRDDYYTDITTGTKRENNRTRTEAELNNQAFFLYHFQKESLYISNSQKKTAFEKMLKEKLKKDFKLKTLFKNIDDFLNVLKECSSIKFSHIKDLFNTDSVQRRGLTDLTGTDAPDEFTVYAKYSKHKIGNFIRVLSEGKQNNQLSSLIINGLDESGFGIVYNTESFQQKIKIDCKKDENGKFDIAEVKNNLLKEIQK